MRLDEKSKSAEAEDAGDDDVHGAGTGTELKQLSARIGKVEKSVRSQATATMREMHDHESQLRGFRTQLTSLANAGGVRLVEIDEDGRAPSIVSAQSVTDRVCLCQFELRTSPTLGPSHGTSCCQIVQVKARVLFTLLVVKIFEYVQDGRLDALEGQLAQLGLQEKRMQVALQVVRREWF